MGPRIYMLPNFDDQSYRGGGVDGEHDHHQQQQHSVVSEAEQWDSEDGTAIMTTSNKNKNNETYKDGCKAGTSFSGVVFGASIPSSVLSLEEKQQPLTMMSSPEQQSPLLPSPAAANAARGRGHREGPPIVEQSNYNQRQTQSCNSRGNLPLLSPSSNTEHLLLNVDANMQYGALHIQEKEYTTQLKDAHHPLSTETTISPNKNNGGLSSSTSSRRLRNSLSKRKLMIPSFHS
jgi:hypothetical protein